MAFVGSRSALRAVEMGIEIASIELRGAEAALFYWLSIRTSNEHRTCARPVLAGFFYKMMNQVTVENFNTLEQRIAAIVHGVLTDDSHFLVSLSVRGVRGSRVVEVFIDGDQGVGVDKLAKYSREISFMLDTEDFIDGRYKLEVSSPGLDRPLTDPRQYGKHMNRKLKVRRQTSEGNTVQTGDLTGIGEGFIELTLPSKEILKIAFSEILESKVQLPW